MSRCPVIGAGEFSSLCDALRGMQDKLAKQPAAVDKLLEDVLEINRKGVEAGHASIMLVTLAPMEVPTQPKGHVAEPDTQAKKLHIPDRPPKGLAPATDRRAEGSGREVMLQVSSLALTQTCVCMCRRLFSRLASCIPCTEFCDLWLSSATTVFAANCVAHQTTAPSQTMIYMGDCLPLLGATVGRLVLNSPCGTAAVQVDKVIAADSHA